MRAHPSLWLAVLLVAFFVSGCRGPSKQDKITASDESSFDAWLSDRTNVMTPADVKELNTARQQIRYKIMQARPGLMSAEFSQAVYAEINGKTLHELLLTSYALQIERMKVELQNYQPQLQRFQAHEKNAQLNDDQKKTVADGLEKLHRLMDEHEQELARLTQRLSELEREPVAVR